MKSHHNIENMDLMAENIDRDLRYIDVMLAEQEVLLHRQKGGGATEDAILYSVYLNAYKAMRYSEAYHSGRLIKKQNPYMVWGLYASAMLASSAAARVSS